LVLFYKNINFILSFRSIFDAYIHIDPHHYQSDTEALCDFHPDRDASPWSVNLMKGKSLLTKTVSILFRKKNVIQKWVIEKKYFFNWNACTKRCMNPTNPLNNSFTTVISFLSHMRLITKGVNHPFSYH